MHTTPKQGAFQCTLLTVTNRFNGSGEYQKRKKMKEERNEYILAFILFLICLISMLFSNKANGQTLKEVNRYIDSIGVKQTDIVMLQVIEETGWLKCKYGVRDCSMDHNNLFGFRYKKKYLEFDTWQESCKYLKRWQVRKGYDGGDYYKFLQKVGWATNPNYIKNLKRINYEK